MIIFGWGIKNKVLGRSWVYECGNCGNQKLWEVIMSWRYFSLFFIPVIKTNIEYIHACPICNRGEELSSRAEAQALLGEALAKGDRA